MASKLEEIIQIPDNDTGVETYPLQIQDRCAKEIYFYEQHMFISAIQNTHFPQHTNKQVIGRSGSLVSRFTFRKLHTSAIMTLM